MVKAKSITDMESFHEGNTDEYFFIQSSFFKLPSPAKEINAKKTIDSVVIKNVSARLSAEIMSNAIQFEATKLKFY